jgi:hypothetical protein
LEKLNWSVVEGKAKMIGTLIGIGGAMIMTFYKGAKIRSPNINLLHAHHNQNGHMEPQHKDFSNKLLGVLCAIGSSCSFSLWFIVQVSYKFFKSFDIFFIYAHQDLWLLCPFNNIVNLN